MIGEDMHVSQECAGMLQRQTDLGCVRNECPVLCHSGSRSLAGPHSWQLIKQQPADRDPPSVNARFMRWQCIIGRNSLASSIAAAAAAVHMAPSPAHSKHFA